MKALIIGIDSNVGTALAQKLQELDWEIYGTSRRAQTKPKIFYVDLEQKTSIANINGEFDVIYACAALTNMMLCENNPELSWQINLDSQIALAEHCMNKTNNYIFLSTTAVFDGSSPKSTVNSKPTPTCVYGLHKAMAETALLNLSSKITIVRTSKVIAANYKLINDWINALKQDLPIAPFHDLNLSPVPMQQLVELLHQIAEHKTHRIIHISGEHDIAYSNLAHILAHKLQKPAHLIQARSYLDAGLTSNMTFPFSSLDMSQTTDTYGLLPAKLEEILNLVLES